MATTSTTTTASTTGPTAAPTSTPPQSDCDERASFPPFTALGPPEDLPDEIRQLAEPGDPIRIGVDEHTVGFAARATPGSPVEGFEIELAREVVERIWGEAAADQIEFVPLETDEKTDPDVVGDLVDMTVSAVSMSCGRWEDVDFSSEYFTATQEFLVPAGTRLATVEDLAGKRVCVTEGSSSARILRDELDPDLETRLVEVPTRADCLVALQLDEADAYFSHDSFLLGMLAEDPTLRIVRGILPAEETTSHYGIAIPKIYRDDVDGDGVEDGNLLVSLVNTALAAIIADNTWGELYLQLRRDLELGEETPVLAPPTPRYRD
jgi:polar amino acid transport system substrate-binding protein